MKLFTTALALIALSVSTNEKSLSSFFASLEPQQAILERPDSLLVTHPISFLRNRHIECTSACRHGSYLVANETAMRECAVNCRSFHPGFYGLSKE